MNKCVEKMCTLSNSLFTLYLNFDAYCTKFVYLQYVSSLIILANTRPIKKMKKTLHVK